MIPAAIERNYPKRLLKAGWWHMSLFQQPASAVVEHQLAMISTGCLNLCKSYTLRGVPATRNAAGFVAVGLVLSALGNGVHQSGFTLFDLLNGTL